MTPITPITRQSPARTTRETDLSSGTPAWLEGFVATLLCLVVTGCGGSNETSGPADESVPPVRTADDTTTYHITPSELRARLRANERARFQVSGNDIVRAELFQSGISSVEALRGIPLQYLDLGMTDVSDLSPLEGMPLTELILENTPVADLSVLKGMKLEGLKLQNTKVTDLSVLQGMPLTQLNLMNVPVSDLTSFSGMPLSTLWIPQTQVTDLSPLASLKLVSLDIQKTAVTSLQPLAAMTTLKRLNIADTGVEDLTPLKDLTLERLTLSPGRIKAGIEVIRGMSSLTQIQPTVETPIDAAEFWKRYDLGVWSELPKDEPSPAPATPDASNPQPAAPGTEDSKGN